MKKTLVIAALTLGSLFCSQAQEKILSLEDAVMNARRIIPIKNPARVSWNEEGMPYEEAGSRPRQAGMGTMNAQETYSLSPL